MGYGEGMQPQTTMDCPGCGGLTSRALVACGPCWRRIPSIMKGQLSATTPGGINRMRVVGSMRLWLKANPR